MYVIPHSVYMIVTKTYCCTEFVTKSGKTIKINRTLADKSRARKSAKALRKAARLKGMPKGRVKRLLFKLHPKRLYKFYSYSSIL